MDDNTKKFGYRYTYTYEFVPKADSKFVRCELIDKKDVYETIIIAEKPKL